MQISKGFYIAEGTDLSWWELMGHSGNHTSSRKPPWRLRQCVCVSGDVWGCISVLEGSCSWISKKGGGHPRCIEVPSGCGSNLCEWEHLQQPQSWCWEKVGEEELFPMDCLLRIAAGKESRRGKCGISNPHPGSQFRFCPWKDGELSVQGTSTVSSYSAENRGFLLKVLLWII